MLQNKIAYTRFSAPYMSRSWLDKNGFKYNSYLTCGDNEPIYTLRFPVMNYGVYITVEAEIVANMKTNELWINCYDKGTRSIYGHWYFTDRDHFEPVVEQINKVIYERIRKLKLKEKENVADN